MGKRMRERAKDYELGDDGSYRYVGTTWRWSFPEERGPFTKAAWLLLAASVACLVGAGFIPARHVGGAVYVLFPYVLAFVGVALAAAAVWGLMREGESLRDHVHESCVVNLEPKLMLGMLASFASAVGAAIQAVVGTGETRLALLFCLLMLVSGSSLGQLLRRVRGLSFTKG